jgi:amidase
METGDVTSEQLTELYLSRIASHNPKLNAIQAVNMDAIRTARALDDERRHQGPRSVLHGIPIIIKDNYETQELPTTVGSVCFKNYNPGRDAHMVTLLKNAGAVLLAKSNMHEFAFGITSVGSSFGHVRNPYNLSRNPGGSSGGTAAAVAANLAVFGMGSDTAGSLRIPASHNCLVALRGTQGLSSRRGIVPLSHTQDIGGPLARTVKDLAMALSLTVGYDPKDAQTAESYGKSSFEYAANLETVSKARIGILVDYMVLDPEDEAVAAVVRSALETMAEEANWEVLDIASPEVNANLAARPKNGHYVLIHEFPSDFNQYVNNNPTLDIKDLNEVIRSGKTHPEVAMSAFLKVSKTETYHAELVNRQVLREALLNIMAADQLDALAYPTIRRVAAPVAADQEGSNARLSSNTGLPAITVPAGFTFNALPVGLELLGAPWSEQHLLNLAHTVETHLNVRRPPPPLPE